MSSQRVLVTGGAGFIGSHLVDALLTAGHTVRVLDALLPQVHPSGPPAYLNPAAELRVGDVRDADAVKAALDGIDTVVHLAAAVGVGQSMYEVRHYCSVNVEGTATLLEAIVKAKRRPGRLLVASSMSIYGEGLYTCPACAAQEAAPRSLRQLTDRQWAVRCLRCNQPMDPRPTPETKTLCPTSVYAISKRDQEEMVLVVARSLGLPAVALRFFNTYGERQALSNPYTGVGAIFSNALLHKRPPTVFEDGEQLRDFTHVSDVAAACRLAVESTTVADEVFNVGTGEATSLLRLVGLLRREIPGAGAVEPEVVGRFREGDIRSCVADITRARERLAFAPRVPIAQGVRSLAQWVASQQGVDRSAEAWSELTRHNLIR
jgi:dTDP-L-rhamnose 4-epimerase